MTSSRDPSHHQRDELFVGSRREAGDARRNLGPSIALYGSELDRPAEELPLLIWHALLITRRVTRPANGDVLNDIPSVRDDVWRWSCGLFLVVSPRWKRQPGDDERQKQSVHGHGLSSIRVLNEQDRCRRRLSSKRGGNRNGSAAHPLQRGRASCQTMVVVG